MNNRMKPTRLVTREQNLAHIRGYDDNADGVLEDAERGDDFGDTGSYDPASRWQVIEGERGSHDDDGNYQIPDYDSYGDSGNFEDDIDDFGNDFNRERDQESRRGLLRKALTVLAVIATSTGIVVGANKLAETRGPELNDLQPGKEYVASDGDTPLSIASEVRDDDPNAPRDVNQIYRDMQGMEANQDVLDPDHDGNLDLIHPGDVLYAPDYSENGGNE